LNLHKWPVHVVVCMYMVCSVCVCGAGCR